MKLNKKAMTLRGFFISILLVTMIGTSMFLLSDMYATETGQSQTFMSGYNQSNELSVDANNMLVQLRSNSTSSFEAVGFFTKGSLSITQILITAYETSGRYLNNIENDFVRFGAGILGLFVSIIATIILIILIMNVVSAIFRWFT